MSINLPAFPITIQPFLLPKEIRKRDKNLIGLLLFRLIISMRGKQPARGAANRGKTSRPGLTEDEVEELREAFNLFDTEATGKIDPK